MVVVPHVVVLPFTPLVSFVPVIINCESVVRSPLADFANAMVDPFNRNVCLTPFAFCTAITFDVRFKFDAFEVLVVVEPFVVELFIAVQWPFAVFTTTKLLSLWLELLFFSLAELLLKFLFEVFVFELVVLFVEDVVLARVVFGGSCCCSSMASDDVSGSGGGGHRFILESKLVVKPVHEYIYIDASDVKLYATISTHT